MIAGAGTVPGLPGFASIPVLPKGKMTLRFKPYTLSLKHVFTIATSSRSTTPVVLTELEFNGETG